MEPKIKIIKTAIKIFLLKGYDATSMRDVGSESKMSKGGIYYHFKNKEELFLNCIDYMFEEFEKWEMNLYTDPPDVKTILNNYFSSLAQINDFVCELAGSPHVTIECFYMLMMEAFTKFPQIKIKHAATHSRGMNYLVNLLKKAQDNGVINENLDCNTVGFMINAIGEGTVLYHILNEKLDLQETGRKLFETIWNGISNEKKQ